VHRESGDRDAVLLQGQLRVWHIASDEELGAVQQEARHRHLVLRQEVLSVAPGAIGEAVSGSEGLHVAGMHSIFGALRRYAASTKL